jgi:hypothetical protein
VDGAVSKEELQRQADYWNDQAKKSWRSCNTNEPMLIEADHVHHKIIGFSRMRSPRVNLLCCRLHGWQTNKNCEVKTWDMFDEFIIDIMTMKLYESLLSLPLRICRSRMHCKNWCRHTFIIQSCFWKLSHRETWSCEYSVMQQYVGEIVRLWPKPNQDFLMAQMINTQKCVHHNVIDKYG